MALLNICIPYMCKNETHITQESSFILTNNLVNNLTIMINLNRNPIKWIWYLSLSVIITQFNAVFRWRKWWQANICRVFVFQPGTAASASRSLPPAACSVADGTAPSRLCRMLERLPWSSLPPVEACWWTSTRSGGGRPRSSSVGGWTLKQCKYSVVNKQIKKTQ